MRLAVLGLLLLAVIGGVALVAFAVSGGGDDDDDDARTTRHHHTTTATTTVTTAAAAAAAVTFTTTTPPPATRSDGGAVSLSALCNEPTAERPGYCRAVFTYNSSHTAPRRIPVGVSNFVLPMPNVDSGQPEVFLPGNSHTASFTWPCGAFTYTRWTVERSSAAHTSARRACPTAST